MAEVLRHTYTKAEIEAIQIAVQKTIDDKAINPTVKAALQTIQHTFKNVHRLSVSYIQLSSKD